MGLELSLIKNLAWDLLMDPLKDMMFGCLMVQVMGSHRDEKT